jgi:hypothetical protein
VIKTNSTELVFDLGLCTRRKIIHSNSVTHFDHSDALGRDVYRTETTWYNYSTVDLANDAKANPEFYRAYGGLAFGAFLTFMAWSAFSSSKEYGGDTTFIVFGVVATIFAVIGWTFCCYNCYQYEKKEKQQDASRASLLPSQSPPRGYAPDYV